MINSIVDLPNSSMPKAGEDVVWYAQSTRMEGKLHGYNVDETPLVTNQFSLPDSGVTSAIIRPKDPNKRQEPNWARLPAGSKAVAAEETLSGAIRKKLDEVIPPGPSYFELISEIYFRGYEVYLVGGTVRDYLQGSKSNDIDLVTTMPLKSAQPVIASMFRDKFSYKPEFGFIRVGGRAPGDPFIDLKNFTVCGVLGGSQVFGGDITSDFKLRDFACNALYYDPVNCNLFDPSGVGIEDARTMSLTLVRHSEMNPERDRNAKIFIRFLKFVTRGYSFGSATLDRIRDEFCPLLATLSGPSLMAYLKTQILSKADPSQHQQAYSDFVDKMEELGFDDAYQRYIKPFEKKFDLRK